MEDGPPMIEPPSEGLLKIDGVWEGAGLRLLAAVDSVLPLLAVLLAPGGNESVLYGGPPSVSEEGGLTHGGGGGGPPSRRSIILSEKI